MKDHHKDKAHPKPHGGGMPYFNQGHFEKKMEMVDTADGRYASELNTAEEYKHQADSLAGYAKKHRMKY